MIKSSWHSNFPGHFESSLPKKEKKLPKVQPFPANKILKSDCVFLDSLKTSMFFQIKISH